MTPQVKISLVLVAVLLTSGTLARAAGISYLTENRSIYATASAYGLYDTHSAGPISPFAPFDSSVTAEVSGDVGLPPDPGPARIDGQAWESGVSGAMGVDRVYLPQIRRMERRECLAEGVCRWPRENRVEVRVSPRH